MLLRCGWLRPRGCCRWLPTCTAESEIDARFFGDELAARPQMLTVAHGSRMELIVTAMRTAHPASAPLARAARMARAAFGGIAEFRRWAASHCDVARQLGISPKTCDHHIQRLYRKTGLSTRAGATLFALEHGLVHPD